MNKILIIDYKINNTKSIYNSIKKVGYEPFVSEFPKDIAKAKKIILPGVGSYDVAMNNLKQNGWVDELIISLDKYEIPMLGICLGMQLLSDSSSEGGGSKGLGLINGHVKKIVPNSNEKIPHVGWNSVSQIKNSPIFKGIPNKCDFYFVHSYHFETSDNSNILASTPFSNSFISAINKSNIYGVQFHPEKSSNYGLKLLENFLNLEKC